HDRLLLRLWLSMPNSRALPGDHEVLWRAVDAGVLRGGIGQSGFPLTFRPARPPAPPASAGSSWSKKPSEASARRSKKDRALSFFGFSGWAPSLCLPPPAEHEPRIDDKDVQRIDREGCNGRCQARDQDPPTARRWSEIRPCRLLR